MNVIFHTTAAVGVATLLIETNKIESATNKKAIIQTSIFAFLVGVISHGALDYIPHCYPINSKIDVLFGLATIVITTWFVNNSYRFIVVSSFTGAIFPDLVDLLPHIVNKKIGLNLPLHDNIFPWHWQKYSGSIYNDDCRVSTLNHILLLVTVGIICWNKRAIVIKVIHNSKEK